MEQEIPATHCTRIGQTDRVNLGTTTARLGGEESSKKTTNNHEQGANHGLQNSPKPENDPSDRKTRMYLECAGTGEKERGTDRASQREKDFERYPSATRLNERWSDSALNLLSLSINRDERERERTTWLPPRRGEVPAGNEMETAS